MSGEPPDLQLASIGSEGSLVRDCALILESTLTLGSVRTELQ